MKSFRVRLNSEDCIVAKGNILADLKPHFFCFLLLFIGLSVLSQPRNVKFERYNSADGLSENSVHTIFKDSHGFMWFGTDDGLNQFDGYSFTAYRPNDTNGRHLPGNRVRSISETQDHNIVVGFENEGLCILNRMTDATEQFDLPLDVGNRSLHYSVYDIEKISDTLFWIATDYGVFEFSPVNGYGVRYMKGLASTGGLGSNTVRDIYSARTGFIWITHDNGIVDKYDQEHHQSVRYNLGKAPCTALTEDTYGNIWIGTWGGGLVRIPPSGNMNIYMPDSTTVGNISDSIIGYHSIAVDELGRLWVGTVNSGLNELSQVGGLDSSYFFIKHKARFVDDMSLPSDEILSVYYDSGGILWIGHRGGGVSKINLRPKRFYNYILPADVLHGRNVQTMTPMRDGTLWVGTQTDGIYIYNEQTNRFDRLFPHRSEKRISQYNDITAIVEDSDGVKWIGTNGGGIFTVSGTDRFVEKVRMLQSSNDAVASVNSLYVDEFKNVWIAVRKGGLLKYNQTTGQMESVNLSTVSEENVEVLNIKRDALGYLWFCTKQHGAYYCRPEMFGENIHIVRLKVSDHQLNHGTVYDVARSLDGRILIATGGGGLNILDRENRIVAKLSEQDGLPSNVIRSVVVDEVGKIWVSTHKGVAVCSPDDLQVHYFNREDGLMTENFMNGSVCKDDAGRIYFGADNGFIAFQPQKIILSYDAPVVVLSELKIFNMSVPQLPDAYNRGKLSGPIYMKDELQLSYKDYVFSIEFAALELNTPLKCQYQYRLVGFDDKWIHTDASKRVATYTNLRGGQYTFMVKSTNGDGVWGKEPTKIDVIIAPPFWETGWFKLLFLLVLFLLLSLWFVYQRKMYENRRRVLESLVEIRTKEVRLQKEALQSQAERLEQVNATKDKFFSIIAHDLKSPFNAFIGFTTMLRSNYDVYPDEKKKYILDIISSSAQSMFELLNNLLSWARTQSGSVEFCPVKLTLRDEVENVLLLLATSAGEKIVTLENVVPAEALVFADKNLLPAILRNLISNSIKFTEEHGSVSISASQVEDVYVIEVADTGVGMTEKQLTNLFRIDAYSSTPGTNKEKGTGLGLVVVKEFVEIHGGEVLVRSEKGVGTHISFTLPIAGDERL